MAKLTHSHRLVRDEVSTHIDSKGVEFGRDEHTVATESFDWPKDIRLSNPVPHSHKNIREVTLEPSKVKVWEYDPPSAREAEKEIGSPTLVGG